MPVRTEIRAGIRPVLGLAWPIMVSMTSHTLMSLFDTAFVAGLGTDAFASMGLAIPAIFMLCAYPMGPLLAVKVAVAQKTGAGDHSSALRLGWQALWLAAILGTVTMLMMPLGTVVFFALGAAPTVAGHAQSYFGVWMLGAPLSFALVGLSGWFQGRGDTRTPMLATVLGNVLNVALDPVLIYGLGPVPALGVTGAAIATVASMGAGTAFLLARAAPDLWRTSWRPDLGLLRLAVSIGNPMGVRRLLDSMGFVAFMRVLAEAGAVDLAAHVLVMRIVGLSFLPGLAVGEAASVIVGQAVGANQLAAARQAWRSALIIALALMTMFGLTFLVVPGVYIAIFPCEPAVAEVAKTLMMIAAAFQIADAVATASLCSLNGAADTRFTMFASTVAAWGINLPLAYGLALGLGLGAVGAWLGLTLEIVALAGLAVWRIQSGAWLSEQRVAKVQAALAASG